MGLGHVTWTLRASSPGLPLPMVSRGTLLLEYSNFPLPFPLRGHLEHLASLFLPSAVHFYVCYPPFCCIWARAGLGWEVRAMVFLHHVQDPIKIRRLTSTESTCCSFVDKGVIRLLLLQLSAFPALPLLIELSFSPHKGHTEA